MAEIIGTGCCGEGVLSCLNTKTLTWSQFCPEATDCGPMRKQGCGMMIYRDENIVVIGGVGIPTCPIQPGEVSSDVLIVRGWTNEIHIFNINQGI